MKNTTIELNGKPVEPRELTLREIEHVLQNLKDAEPHPLESVVPDEPVSALAIALSLAPSPLKEKSDIDHALDALLDLSPSQVKEAAVMVRDKNPSLARVIEGLGTLAAKFLAADLEEKDNQTSPELSTISDAQPAD